MPVVKTWGEAQSDASFDQNDAILNEQLRRAGAKQVAEETFGDVAGLDLRVAADPLLGLVAGALGTSQVVGESIGLVPESGRQVVQSIRDIQQGIQEQIASGQVAGGNDTQVISDLTSPVISSALTMAAGAPAGFGGVLASSAIQNYGDSYFTAKERGFTDSEANTFGLTSAAIETAVTAAFQKVGAGGLEQGFSNAVAKSLIKKLASRQGIKSAMKHGAAEILEEDIITLAQAANTALQGVDPSALDPERVAEDIWKTTKSTALMMGAVGAGMPAVNRSLHKGRVKQRMERKQRLEALEKERQAAEIQIQQQMADEFDDQGDVSREELGTIDKPDGFNPLDVVSKKLTAGAEQDILDELVNSVQKTFGEGSKVRRDKGGILVQAPGGMTIAQQAVDVDEIIPDSTSSRIAVFKSALHDADVPSPTDTNGNEITLERFQNMSAGQQKNALKKYAPRAITIGNPRGGSVNVDADAYQAFTDPTANEHESHHAMLQTLMSNKEIAQMRNHLTNAGVFESTKSVNQLRNDTQFMEAAFADYKQSLAQPEIKKPSVIARIWNKIRQVFGMAQQLEQTIQEHPLQPLHDMFTSKEIFKRAPNVQRAPAEVGILQERAGKEQIAFEKKAEREAEDADRSAKDQAKEAVAAEKQAKKERIDKEKVIISRVKSDTKEKVANIQLNIEDIVSDIESTREQIFERKDDLRSANESEKEFLKADISDLNRSLVLLRGQKSRLIAEKQSLNALLASGAASVDGIIKRVQAGDIFTREELILAKESIERQLERFERKPKKNRARVRKLQAALRAIDQQLNITQGTVEPETVKTERIAEINEEIRANEKIIDDRDGSLENIERSFEEVTEITPDQRDAIEEEISLSKSAALEAKQRAQVDNDELAAERDALTGAPQKAERALFGTTEEARLQERLARAGAEPGKPLTNKKYRKVASDYIDDVGNNAATAHLESLITDDLGLTRVGPLDVQILKELGARLSSDQSKAKSEQAKDKVSEQIRNFERINKAMSQAQAAGMQFRRDEFETPADRLASVQQKMIALTAEQQAKFDKAFAESPKKAYALRKRILDARAKVFARMMSKAGFNPEMSEAEMDDVAYAVAAVKAANIASHGQKKGVIYNAIWTQSFFGPVSTPSKIFIANAVMTPAMGATFIAQGTLNQIYKTITGDYAARFATPKQAAIMTGRMFGGINQAIKNATFMLMNPNAASPSKSRLGAEFGSIEERQKLRGEAKGDVTLEATIQQYSGFKQWLISPFYRVFNALDEIPSTIIIGAVGPVLADIMARQKGGTAAEGLAAADRAVNGDYDKDVAEEIARYLHKVTAQEAGAKHTIGGAFIRNTENVLNFQTESGFKPLRLIAPVFRGPLQATVFAARHELFLAPFFLIHDQITSKKYLAGLDDAGRKALKDRKARDLALGISQPLAGSMFLHTLWMLLSDDERKDLAKGEYHGKDISRLEPMSVATDAAAMHQAVFSGDIEEAKDHAGRMLSRIMVSAAPITSKSTFGNPIDTSIRGWGSVGVLRDYNSLFGEGELSNVIGVRAPR